MSLRFPCFIVFVLLPHTVFCLIINAAETPSVALVFSRDQNRPSPIVESTLFDRLSKIEKIVLVEREAIHAVLSEHKLNVPGLIDPAKAIQLGRLIAADAFVLVEMLRTKDSELVRLRLVESRTGIRLSDDVFASELIADDESYIDSLRASLDKLNLATSKRRYVSVLGLKSEEPGRGLNTQANATKVLLEQDLLRLDNVIVIERRQLELLTAERNLTDIELRLRAAAFLLEGGLRREQDRLVATLRLIPVATGKARKLRIEVPADAPHKLREAVLGAVQTELGGNAPVSRPHDTKNEAERFAIRSRWQLAHRELADAISLAETALALDSSREHHDWAYFLHNGPAYPNWSLTERLEHGIRAQEIDTANLASLLTTEPGAPSYLFARVLRSDARKHAIRENGQRPLSSQEKRLLDQLNRLLLNKYNTLYQSRLRLGHSVKDLLVMRLQSAVEMTSTADECAKLVRSVQGQFDLVAADSIPDATRRGSFYLSYCQSLARSFTAAMRRGEHIGTWPHADLQPLFVETARHDEALVRVVGHHGLSLLPGADALSAAKRGLETLFHETQPPAGSTERYRILVSDMIGRIRRAGAFDDFFETLIDKAEQANDATSFVRWPKPVHECVNTSPHAVEWCRRLIVLLDAKSYHRSEANKAAMLRRELESVLKLRTRRLTAPTTGPWVDYTLTEIPISNIQPEKHQRLMLARVSNRPAAQRGDHSIWLVWRGRPTPPTSIESNTFVVTRLGIAGGEMTALGEYRSPGQPTCMATSNSRVAIGQRTGGLVLLGPTGVRLFDEKNGLPSNTVNDIAWTDEGIYLLMPGAIAKMDPDNGTSTLLASSKLVETRGPLDGGTQYTPTSILADPARRCLWISIDNGKLDPRSGIWKYLPQSNVFKHVVRGLVSRLTWSDDRVFFRFAPERFEKLDPRTTSAFQTLDPQTEQLSPLVGIRSFTPSTGGMEKPGWVLIRGHVMSCSRHIFAPDGSRYLPTDSIPMWHTIFRFREGAIAVTRKNASTRLWSIQPNNLTGTRNR